ncbi:hypothetical protein AGMMS50276_32670 [Synergistales bacterium]|nr:hypothetical protein AGMMS50276_32670 [Synergistales bacterium]
MTKKQPEYRDYFQLGNPLTKFKSVISHKARNKMFRHFMSLTNPKRQDKVLDVGVTPDTTLPESNFFEKLYPYLDNVTMTSVEDASCLKDIFKGAEFIQTMPDEKFPFNDKQFDILFCSAVLEHVGDYPQQGLFLRECIRVARKIYLTTPNRTFPVEFHTYLPFIHYLPRAIHQKLLSLMGLEFWANTQNLNLLTKKKLLSLVPINHAMHSFMYCNRLLGLSANLILYIDTTKQSAV